MASGASDGPGNRGHHWPRSPSLAPLAPPRSIMKPLPPSMLVVACFSRHPQALAWAEERLREKYGPVLLTSPDFDFHQTAYYEPTMGPGLKKRFLAFADHVATDSLADIK